MAPVLVISLLIQIVAARQQLPSATMALEASTSAAIRRPQDCWQKRAVSHKLALLGQAQVQNASDPKEKEKESKEEEKIVPFETVQKDGYMRVACVKDNMYYHGEIFHYADYVPKEDRKTMTPTVCFDFCRTIPNMLFFGITNGRECYCGPYYQAMASDSTQCDAVCEGETTQMCGGKSKSTVWEMHMCSNTKKDLEDMGEMMTTLLENIEEEEGNLTTLAEEGQAIADELQVTYGKIGDPTAADLFQQAKVRAGVLEERAKMAKGVADKIKEIDSEYKDLDGEDFTSFDAAKKAEDLIKRAKKVAAEGKAAREVIAKELKLQRRIRGEEGQERLINSSQLYYPAMYFVDKIYLTDQATCDGDLTGPPKFGLSLDACAYACETEVGKCTAFSHYSAGGGICFLFSKLKTLTHYSDCLGRKKEDKPVFLQRISEKDRAFASYLQKVEEERKGDVPFKWKTKSTKEDPAGFKTAVTGLCTQAKDCGALTANATLSDCSLMDDYTCRGGARGSKFTDRQDDGVDVLRMEFRGSVRSGKRSSSCKINPTPCDQCKIYSTCVGPWAETEKMKIPKGNVAKYTWRSSGATDNYEVFVGLYDSAGLVDYQFQRGKMQPWKSFELMSPKTDDYYLKFYLGSYDGSGGGAVGADMEMKNIVMGKSEQARSATTASCVVKFANYEGTTLRPDPSGKSPGTLKEVTKRCLRSGGAIDA